MIVIIGAGISSLYLGYILNSLKKEFIILEKCNRYGGRVYVNDFEGKNVVLGAGIGRLKKDKTLYNLCKKLNVPVKTYPVKISYSFPIKKSLLYYVDELKTDLEDLNEKDIKNLRSEMNFKEFLMEEYKNPMDFIKTSGYSDYINADIIDTLYDYGFDDNVSGWEGFSVDWQVLLDNLYGILKNRIHLNEKVLEIDVVNSVVFTKSNNKNNSYKYDTLVCSTPVNISRKLFPNIKILSEINCQSFSRIYVKVSDGNAMLKEKIKNFTVVDSFLQKVIPIDVDKGIYMLGYNDNDNADLGFKYFTTLDEKEVYNILEQEIYKIFKVKVKIEVSKIAYWDYGTTYYLPLSKEYRDRDEWLSKARNPIKNVFFIGEGFSHNQGWVQGCLESVDSIVDFIK